MQSMWEQQRNNNLTAKNAHMAVVACERYQAAENGINLTALYCLLMKAAIRHYS
ncbi:hypothetical protein MZB01_01730 [Haemophilus influenzae]